RRLAGPVRPDQADDLAAAELEVDLLERGDALERPGDAESPERAGLSTLRYGRLGQWIFAGEDAVWRPTNFALLLLIAITR
ncbi:MAG TPA: hypothetical protein VIU16_09550, partial [Gaiellaceae bacterium]